MKIQKEDVIRVFDDLASKSSWERLYSGHIDRIRYNFVTRLRAVEELIDLNVKGDILDVGCGTGDLAPFVTRKGAIYHGVDLSAEMIKRANTIYSVLVKNGKATFQIGDCENLHFCDKKFNTVIAIGLIEYLPDPSRFLSEMERVTKSGGYFLITVPYKECINSKIRKLLFPIKSILFPIYAKLKNPHLVPAIDVKHYSYNEIELDELMENRNFRRVDFRFTNFHIIPHPLDHLLPKLYMKISERIDRKGLGVHYKKWASNYIALFQKN
ncbi:MAG: class I SAM-dependent methyltransferase [Candidatus Aminicenantaceae bacterium]